MSVLVNGTYTALPGDTLFWIEDTFTLNLANTGSSFISFYQVDVGLDGIADLQLMGQHVHPQCGPCLMDIASSGMLHFDGGERFSVMGGVSSYYDAYGTSTLMVDRITAVPEPATWLLMICGFILLLGVQKFFGRKEAFAS